MKKTDYPPGRLSPVHIARNSSGFSQVRTDGATSQFPHARIDNSIGKVSNARINGNPSQFPHARVDDSRDFSNASTDSSSIQFFHVCTDGTSNGIVHFDDDDYKRASTVAAIAAYKCGVRIMAHVHMSTHSHFVIWCMCEDDAEKFINEFKRMYSQYIFYKYNISGIYSGIESKPRRITDIYDLKGCIAYTLLNPVVPGIVSRPENYPWSSICLYFSPVKAQGLRSINELSAREIRKVLKTHTDLKGSGFLVDGEGNIAPHSFVDIIGVERLFGGLTELYRAMALTDYAGQEQVNVPRTITYDDTELRAEAVNLAQKRYSTDRLDLLTRDQKSSLIFPIKNKTGASAARIARILRLKPEFVRKLTGTDIP